MKPIFAAALIVSACVPPMLAAPRMETVSTLSEYNGHRCTKTVASVLDTYKVSPDAIDGVFYTPRRDGQGRDLGFNAWMEPANQTGYMVVDVDPSCQFEQAYTRGGASFPGVPSF